MLAETCHFVANGYFSFGQIRNKLIGKLLKATPFSFTCSAQQPYLSLLDVVHMPLGHAPSADSPMLTGAHIFEPVQERRLLFLSLGLLSCLPGNVF
jgi:hypothetical protein